MKKSFVIFLSSIILTYIFSFIAIPYSTAYWGWGDCRDGHDMEYVNVPYDEDANLILDGVPSESFWTDSRNQKGKIQIPLAGELNTSGFFVVYLNMAFVMNDEYIYLHAQWNDSTTRPSGGLKDGLYICWNMNVPNFTAAFLYGMDTTEMGGGCVDCWAWECRSTSPANGSSYEAIDDSFDEDGWNHSPLDFTDVNTGYIYRTDHSYSVEFKRKITTLDDDYDVSFQEKKLYEFNLGIMNDGMGYDHAISWTYALDLRPEGNHVIFGFDVIHIMLLGSFTIIYLIYHNRKKEFLKKKDSNN